MSSQLQELTRSGSRILLASVAINTTLTVVKILGGMLGHSQALIADGIESGLDIFSSAIIWGAFQYSGKPPDPEHPYGHGKLESLAAVVGAIFVLGAGAAVAIHSGLQIVAQYTSVIDHAQHMPKSWTLLVLLGVITIKEALYRILMKRGTAMASSAIQAEAWHHRSDAITSFAAFAGISIALIGGKNWESADNWAALFSCVLILKNGLHMLRKSVGEIIDEQVSAEIVRRVEGVAAAVNGVSSTEKCRVRKSGLTLLADIHIRVPAIMTVQQGHTISHEVKDRLLEAGLNLSDVTVHLEPEAPSLSRAD